MRFKHGGFEGAEERIVCPKCDAESGDDWSQCEGVCPHFRAQNGQTPLLTEAVVQE